MDPTETGKKYDTLTHLWESEKFNRQNGVEAHKRACLLYTSDAADE